MTDSHLRSEHDILEHMILVGWPFLVSCSLCPYIEFAYYTMLLSPLILHLPIVAVALISFSCVCIGSPANDTDSPSVTVKNGTLNGKYLPAWDQDAFPGIPYAEPPHGPLRFRYPQSLNFSYNGTLDASQYGYSCLQCGTNFNLSEDCLTLNGKAGSITSNGTN